VSYTMFAQSQTKSLGKCAPWKREGCTWCLCKVCLLYDTQRPHVFFLIVIVRVGLDCVSVELRLLTGTLSIPQMIHEWIWSSGGMILTGENRRTRRKTCPSATVTNPIGLPWSRIWASAVRSRRLTAWAMTQPASSCFGVESPNMEAVCECVGK
jgi:hypothetical protein